MSDDMATCLIGRFTNAFSIYIAHGIIDLLY